MAQAITTGRGYTLAGMSEQPPEIFDDLYLGVRAGGALRKQRRGEALTAEELEALGRWRRLSPWRKGLAIGGFTAAGASETVTKGIPTNARIAAGGIVEREIGFDLQKLQQVRISLRNPDFTTARRMAEAMNAFLGTDAARPSDPAISSIVRRAMRQEEC